VNFGIQEENHFTDQEREAFPGAPVWSNAVSVPGTQPASEWTSTKRLPRVTDVDAGPERNYYPPDRKIDGTFCASVGG